MGRYSTDFRLSRTTFALGLTSLLLSVTVRARAVFEPGVDDPVAFIVACASATILVLYLRTEAEVFSRLGEKATGSASSLASGVILGAIAFALLEGTVGRGMLISSEIDSLAKALPTLGQ